MLLFAPNGLLMLYLYLYLMAFGCIQFQFLVVQLGIYSIQLQIYRESAEGIAALQQVKKRMSSEFQQFVYEIQQINLFQSGKSPKLYSIQYNEYKDNELRLPHSLYVYRQYEGMDGLVLVGSSHGMNEYKTAQLNYKLMV